MTNTELKDRVLQKLRVIASGASAGTDDGTLVSDKYLEIYEELNNQGLVDWEPGTSATITTSHANHIVTIVASRCSDDFEIDEAMIFRLLQEEEKSMGKLKELAHRAYVSHSEPEYY